MRPETFGASRPNSINNPMFSQGLDHDILSRADNPSSHSQKPILK